MIYVAMTFGREGPTVANSTTGQVWPILLIGNNYPWKIYYVALPDWLGFLCFVGLGIAVAAIGLSKVTAEPKPPAQS
jgi:hypothetical protein